MPHKRKKDVLEELQNVNVKAKTIFSVRDNINIFMNTVSKRVLHTLKMSLNKKKRSNKSELVVHKQFIMFQINRKRRLEGEKSHLNCISLNDFLFYISRFCEQQIPIKKWV